MGKFVVKTVPTGIKFDLVSEEGAVLATSEVYSSEAACKNGVESVAKNAPAANLEDQTAEGFKTETNPKFEVYADKAGDFRFRLKSRNGQIVAISGAFKSVEACKEAVEAVRKNAEGAAVEKA